MSDNETPDELPPCTVEPGYVSTTVAINLLAGLPAETSMRSHHPLYSLNRRVSVSLRVDSCRSREFHECPLSV